MGKTRVANPQEAPKARADPGGLARAAGGPGAERPFHLEAVQGIVDREFRRWSELSRPLGEKRRSVPRGIGRQAPMHGQDAHATALTFPNSLGKTFCGIEPSNEKTESGRYSHDFLLCPEPGGR
jgi:hypothetical protein